MPKKSRQPGLKAIFKDSQNEDFYRQKIHQLADPGKPFLPVNNQEFDQCSAAIRTAAGYQNAPMPLPSDLLPPV